MLNLPDANMLNKLSPFFAIVFSIFLLREKPNLVQVLGVLVAFGGSVCIIKPSFDNPQALPALAGALGGLGAGAAYTFVRYLGARGENGSRIVFYFSAFSCLVCLPLLLLDYEPLSARQLIYLLLAGAVRFFRGGLFLLLGFGGHARHAACNAGQPDQGSQSHGR